MPCSSTFPRQADALYGALLMGFHALRLEGAEARHLRIAVGLPTSPGRPTAILRYEWLPVKTRLAGESHRELVRCGQSTPVIMPCKDGQQRLGYLDLSTEIALVSVGGKTESLAGGPAQELLAIFRNLRPPPTGIKIYEDLWGDMKYGDAFPNNVVPADNRPLKTETGPMNQYVALWYKHGEPVFGRAFPSPAGKIMASFGATNQENAGPEIGSMQMLTVPDASNMGLEYKWLTMAEGKNGWETVHVGNAAPVIVVDEKGNEYLGNYDIGKDKASFGWSGKEKGNLYQMRLIRHMHPFAKDFPWRPVNAA
ncbi:hypothetical protein Y032_0261g551 [Ancylostoma ceylanicum]|nr:hypothetical protein Y032_0261g551 [Ancylostoma ceylanicum]